MVRYLVPNGRRFFSQAGRRNRLRATDRVTRGDYAIDRATREEIQVLLFLLPPSAKTTPLLLLPLLLSPSLGLDRSKSTIIDQFCVVTAGNNHYLAVPPGSERSTYRSAGEPIHAVRYRALPPVKVNLALKTTLNSF
ncbi:hypothetical protein BHE74_00055541 [Ensete ventricosum]|nr:hypothetical protein BHE74_00055541 [Ensete ventricosum]